jgi:hypothetical protein
MTVPLLKRLPRTIEKRWWQVMASLEPLDPSYSVAQARFRRAPEAELLAVYRYENASSLGAICAELGATAGIHLWALDRTHPQLERWTEGQGAGLRSDLLNVLFERVCPGFKGYVLLCDDDFQFTRGGIRSFLATAAAASLDIAQPAHDRYSRWSHWLTVARRSSLARLTSFVEIGPLAAISPEWRDHVLPLPENSGMGWGLDLAWGDLRHLGCRLGIVDCTLIRHLYPAGGSGAYDVQAGISDMAALYAERGGYETALRTLATWWPWQRRPSWTP